jgi:ribonuclease HII
MKESAGIGRRKWPDLTAGVDEAGRGPLAGPVVVAAVILDPAHEIAGLDDSKRLSEKRRESLFPLICEYATAWRVEAVMPGEIDSLNILQATLVGMQRAVMSLNPGPELALIDGNRAPGLECSVQTIVQGDRKIPAISAASILAKVSRDRMMTQLHRKFPQYGFSRHKGYPTPEHLKILDKLGPCPAHRRSFAPVRRALRTGMF